MAEVIPPSEESAGMFLRRTREQRGVSLDEASRVTRIGKNYLSDIEEDRFEKLPNPAYVKGFLRSYAGFLGASADDIIRRYERAAEQEHPAEPQEPPAQRRKPQPLAYLVVTAVVVLAGIGYMVGQKEDQVGGTPVAHREIVPVPSPVQPAITSARKPAPDALVRSGEQPSSSGESLPAKGVFLRLKINEDTKLFMNIDGAVTQEYALNAGDLIEWKGENFFIIDVDDPAGVEAELNGKKLPPLGASGAPAHVVLRPEGVAPGIQEQGDH